MVKIVAHEMPVAEVMVEMAASQPVQITAHAHVMTLAATLVATLVAKAVKVAE